MTYAYPCGSCDGEVIISDEDEFQMGMMATHNPGGAYKKFICKKCGFQTVVGWNRLNKIGRRLD